MTYAILRGRRVIFSTNVRHTVFRLARTRAFHGVVCQYVYGEWRPINDG